MTAVDLQQWQQRMAQLYGELRWTQERAAAEIGIGLRTYQRYASGQWEIPLRLELACEGAEGRALLTVLAQEES